jgi:hypothetical protein
MTPTISTLRALAPLESFTGFGGVALKVNTTSWPVGTPTEAVVAGTAMPSAWVATQDGRHVYGGNAPAAWHEGASEADVYYERYEVRSGVLAMGGSTRPRASSCKPASRARRRPSEGAAEHLCSAKGSDRY